MRGLMAAVIGMGVLIVAGVTVLVVVMVQRMSAPPAQNASVVAAAPATAVLAAAALDEPVGTRIAAVSLAGDRLAIQLAGAGPDRVVVVDVRTGRTVARATLAQ